MVEFDVTFVKKITINTQLFIKAAVDNYATALQRRPVAVGSITSSGDLVDTQKPPRSLGRQRRPPSTPLLHLLLLLAILLSHPPWIAVRNPESFTPNPLPFLPIPFTLVLLCFITGIHLWIVCDADMLAPQLAWCSVFPDPSPHPNHDVRGRCKLKTMPYRRIGVRAHPIATPGVNICTRTVQCVCFLVSPQYHPKAGLELAILSTEGGAASNTLSELYPCS